LRCVRQRVANSPDSPRRPRSTVTPSRYAEPGSDLGEGSATATGKALVDWAAEHAAELLVPLGDRWLHCRAVGERARRVADAFSQQDSVQLVAAAYLHDVGDAPGLQQTGCHALDGARYLRSLGHERLARLVAHHAEARFEAQLRGLDRELEGFPREKSAVADALTYCDMTVGSAGEPMTLHERALDIARRYGDEHAATRSLAWSMPYLSLALARTERRLRLRGVVP
jgi:HD domain-containing protein